MHRRQFLTTSAALAAAFTLPGRAASQAPVKSDSRPGLDLHIFSKHLQFLDYEPMAEAAAEMGFAGVDLTVRRNGHVDPANAARDLPRAAAALRRHGLAPVMLTTSFTAIDEPHCDTVFGAASDAGFQHLRLGSPRFPATGSITEAMEALKPQVAALADALARAGLTGAFQNHAGPSHVGASLWELWQLTEAAPGIGVHYDIRHATVERGRSWPIELRLIASRITALCLKDFRWEEEERGRPRLVNTPIGEGWVDFPRYFSMLRAFGFSGPASLHLEYPMGGAENGRRELSVPPAELYAALRRDRSTLLRLWQDAAPATQPN